ncbi:glycosyltransferase [Niallia circulans]|uniref:glycosyltransferase n=1 Tax=Niallia circulans TaxID=1397 RepID=UPI00203BDD2E|nr:glycosyltransferase [Niallia circulans]MCM2983531.1 glycosyltransferase [Niallia circulans]
MIMKQDILFIPWRDWDKMKIEGFRTREANILLELLSREDINKILCINRSKIPKIIKKPIELLVEKGNLKEPIKSGFKETTLVKRPFSKIIEVEKKLFILDLNYHIPNPKGNKLERIEFFENILKNEITYAINYLGLENHIVWNFDLSRANTANYFKRDLLIFDAIDNLLEHNDFKNDRRKIAEQYQKVESTCDLIFSVSESIKEDLFKSLEKVTYIPNGVNLRLFRDTPCNIPNDLPRDRPIVGYVGLMQERIDTEGLRKMIMELPNVNFVFIGPVLSPEIFKDIKSIKNVFFLGSKHHSEIATYINSFDICIIPHRVNNFTKSMNPLKLYEYLAASKEVVTTPVPPYESFKDVLHVVEKTEDMSNVINRILSNPYEKFSKTEINKRIAKETWTSRVNLMIKKIKTQIEWK